MIKIKTKWDLNLFYKSANDPQIKKDVEKAKIASVNFEKKYAKKDDYLKNEDKLLKTLQDYEKLELTDGTKPILYFHYRKDIDGKDLEAEASLNKLVNELTEYENKTLFFGLRLGKIEKKLQDRFLKSKKLAKYHYLLKKTFETSKYNLTEPEEKIMNLKNLPSYNLWVSGVKKSISKKTIKFKGKTMSIGEAQYQVANFNTKNRRVLNKMIAEKLDIVSDFAESELNAVVLNKKISDELRGFKNPYSATILGYENNEKSIINLVNTVTDNFKISNRFYILKKKLLKLKTLEYSDRSAKIGKTNKKISFTDAYKILHPIFKDVDPEYASILDKMLSNGQIDVYPRLGKTGGAYCSSSTNMPTVVLLNQTDDFKSLMTFAHEMGHAIHSELSKSQPVFYEEYVIPVAETASTFFEQLVFTKIFETLNNKDKIVALHDKIQGDIETIFRQIAAFNFETELHNSIRAKGSLSSDEIGELHNKHMKTYLGPVFKMQKIDGLAFVTWSHFRRFFYVYAYSYGQIISRALNVEYKKDKNFGKKIKQFLSAGGSKSPDDIFKDIGINTTKPNFFKNALFSIEEDIKKLEELTKSTKI
jgi:oligoendopeptidase F